MSNYQGPLPTKEEQELTHKRNQEEFRKKYGELPLEMAERQNTELIEKMEKFINEKNPV